MPILDVLDENVIKIPLISETKTEVLDELVEILDKAGKLKNRNKVFESVLAREEQGTTGLEKGIAIPHCKTDGVENITLSVGVAPQGIDFEALDGNPSKLFFLVVAPPGQTGPHIEALKEISVLVSNDEIKNKLINAKTPEEFLKIINN